MSQHTQQTHLEHKLFIDVGGWRASVARGAKLVGVPVPER